MKNNKVSWSEPLAHDGTVPIVSNLWSDLIHEQDVWRWIYRGWTHISIIPWVYISVCNGSLGCVIWPNYEVMGLQPWSGITIVLYYVSYCYVPIPRLLQYSSSRLNHHTGSSSYLVLSSLCPIISILCTGSSAHLGVAHIHPRISNSPIFYPQCYPCTLLRVPIKPSNTFSFPVIFHPRLS